MEITFTYFLFLSLIFGVILALGWLISNLLELDNPICLHHLVFRNSLIGMVLSVSVYAGLMTLGKTILSGLIILLFYYLIFRKQRNNKKIKYSKTRSFRLKNIGFVAAPLVFFFSWKITYVLGLDSSYPNVINADDLCHVQRAMFFNQFGIETADINFLQIPNGVQPFHYFESWQIAFFQKITQSNFWLSEQLIAIPITCAMIFYGMVTIVKKIKLNNYVYYFSIIAAFGGAIYLPHFINHSFLKWSGAFNSNPFTEYWAMKYGILYVLIINFIILYISDHKKWAILSLLSLPIISITLAPSILLATLIILFYLKFKKTIEISIIELFMPLIIGLYIVFFYALLRPDTLMIEMPGIRSVIGEFFVPNNIKRNLIIMIEKVIHVTTFYSPYLIMYFIIRKNIKTNSKDVKTLFQAFGILLVITIVALPMWPLFYSTFGSSEFFNYPAIAIYNIVGIIVLLNFIGKKRSIVNYILGVAFTFFFMYKAIITNNNFQLESAKQMYSSKYLENIYNLKHLFSGMSGATINDNEEFHSGHHHNKYGFYVYGFSEEPTYNISLSRYIEKMPAEYSLQREIFIKTSPFYRYVSSLISNDQFIDIKKAQLAFLNEYEISYLIIHPGSKIPEYIAPLIEKTIVDEKSGERFILLQK